MTLADKKEVKIRTLVDADLPRVNEIDQKLKSGEERLPTWPFSFEAYWTVHKPKIKLVAEVDDLVMGFVVGTITEVSQSQSVLNLRHTIENPSTHRKIGWIDMIGIDPDSQHMGIGRTLASAFIDECKKNDAVAKGIAKENDAKFRGFLSNVGFKSTDLVVYEKEIL
jgi:ribosomal protein S18 acetylase RimI-like enzyme